MDTAIRKANRRRVPPQEDEKRRRLRHITERIIGLPTLPTVVTEIISLVDNPRSSADDLARVISTDQALTAKMLKIANSALYGFPRRISTVALAVVVLGFETIKNLCLGVSVLEKFAWEGEDGLFDRQKFWEHAVGCGVAGRILAKKVKYRLAGEVFVAGILHDIGKLILSQYFGDEFAAALVLAQEENLYISEAEERVLGVTHAEVGGWLAERWNLPRQLVEVIAFHHDPTAARKKAELTALIHMANALCRNEGIGNSGDEQGPSLDLRAPMLFWNVKDAQEAESRLFRLGLELHDEVGKAETLISIAKGQEIEEEDV